MPQESFLGSTLFLLYINDLPDDVICNIAIYADDTTLYSNCDRHLICGNNLNWLLNLNLIYETLWTGAGSGLLISMLEKLIWLDQSNNTVTIAVKMDGSVIEEKSSFKMLWLNFSSKLNWAVKLFLLLKLPPRKLKP